ncbi:nitroreductase/quinone reductase family protein [Rhodococcus sp. TAF43]|uniref:nitroreductase/quinone reductase family protein n=1 Tax=Rhodococcus sp. TAF43 TaxID=3237483 RepID=UPI003F9B220C
MGQQVRDGPVRRGGRFMNLAAHPDRVTIEVGGESIPVTARELQDTERDDAWATITAAAPQFTEYEQKTDRELPVIGQTRRT